MQTLLSSFLTPEGIPALLAALFLIVALLIGLVVPVVSRPYSHVVKLLGSLMVVGLSLIANSAFVYAVSIFVIATLVTDLEFLEKLAAIVWNRKEYWNYLIERASPREVEEKRAADALEAETQAPAEEDPGQAKQDQLPKELAGAHERQQLIAFAQRFEEQVIAAINSGASPFEGTSVTPSVRVQSVQKNQPGSAIIVDAIARRGSTHFIIEVKAFQRQPRNFNDSTYKVKMLSDFYRAALLERGEHLKIAPVLVIPSSLQIDTLRNGVVVLRFDQERGVFVNGDNARQYLDGLAT